MKIAVISDIHDNLARLDEALTECRHQKIKTCVCCGDVGRLETLQLLADNFRDVYLALGNLDYNIAGKTGVFPENVTFNKDALEVKLDNISLAVVHNDSKAREIAKEGKYNVVFYGHTHTPWEKKIGNSLLLNPGEVSGQFGKASFAIFDTEKISAKLIILD